MRSVWLTVVCALGLAQGAFAQDVPAPAAAPAPDPEPGLCSAAEAQKDWRCALKITVVRKGWVVVEGQTALRLGSRYYILSQRRVRGVAPGTKPGDPDTWVPEGERTGMLVLERVRGNHGAGRLVRNAYAEVGDLAVPTMDRYKESLVYGRRIPNTFRLVVDARPVVLFASTTGGGLFGSMALEYRFRIPVKLAVEFVPLTLGGGVHRNVPGASPVLYGGLRGVLGLALSGFELSVGLGAGIDSGRARPQGPVGLEMGLSLRGGSLDGLHSTLDATFVLPVGSRPVEFSSGAFGFHIPVHRRLTLSLAVGGGNPFNIWGTLGFRVYVKGTGGPGTWILNTGVGGGAITVRNQCPPPSTDTLGCISAETTGAGPVFHLGLDRRF